MRDDAEIFEDFEKGPKNPDDLDPPVLKRLSWKNFGKDNKKGKKNNEPLSRIIKGFYCFKYNYSNFKRK